MEGPGLASSESEDEWQVVEDGDAASPPALRAQQEIAADASAEAAEALDGIRIASSSSSSSEADASSDAEVVIEASDDDEADEWTTCATLLQTTWRRRARCRALAATRIAAAWRGAGARATVVLLRSTIALLHDSASLVQEAWRARAAAARSRAATIEQQPPASPPTPLLEVPAQRKRGRPRSADGKKRAVISVPFFGFARPKTPPPPQLPLISSTRLII